MTFASNTRYALLDADRYDDEYGEGFDHVETFADVDGCWIADCWVVNEHGEIHPGYSENPIPIRFDDIAPASAVPGSNTERPRSPAFWR